METKIMHFAIDCFQKYIRMRQDNGLGPPNTIDIAHSSLLRRLLSGKDPLPKPPPKRYSYPSYDLGEGKPVKISELFERDDYVIIDQTRAWRWADKTQGILIHDNGDRYKLTSCRDNTFIGVLQKMEETCQR